MSAIDLIHQYSAEQLLKHKEKRSKQKEEMVESYATTLKKMKMKMLESQANRKIGKTEEKITRIRPDGTIEVRVYEGERIKSEYIVKPQILGQVNDEDSLGIGKKPQILFPAAPMITMSGL